MKINLNFAGCIRKGESPGEKLKGYDGRPGVSLGKRIK